MKLGSFKIKTLDHSYNIWKVIKFITYNKLVGYDGLYVFICGIHSTTYLPNDIYLVISMKEREKGRLPTYLPRHIRDGTKKGYVKMLNLKSFSTLCSHPFAVDVGLVADQWRRHRTKSKTGRRTMLWLMIDWEMKQWEPLLCPIWSAYQKAVYGAIRDQCYTIVNYDPRFAP